MVEMLTTKSHMKRALALTAMTFSKSYAMGFKFLGHNEEAKPHPSLLTMAQTFKQQLDESS